MSIPEYHPSTSPHQPHASANAADTGQTTTRSGRRVTVVAGVAAVLVGCAFTATMACLRLGTNPAPAALPEASPATHPSTELQNLRTENAQLRRVSEDLVRAAAQLRGLTEKRSAKAGNPKPAASTLPSKGAEWTLLFRSDIPLLWNSNLNAGEVFAAPVVWAPADMRYLRLCRMDTGEALIIPLRYEQLRDNKPPTDSEPVRWSGTAHKEWEGCHLGIAEAPRYHFPVRKGMICVMMDGWDAFAGSGFGHKAFVNDQQYYCWRGQEIAPTVFEIAVSAGPLGTEEEKCLLTTP